MSGRPTYQSLAVVNPSTSARSQLSTWCIQVATPSGPRRCAHRRRKRPSAAMAPLASPPTAASMHGAPAVDGERSRLHPTPSAGDRAAVGRRSTGRRWLPARARPWRRPRPAMDRRRPAPRSRHRSGAPCAGRRCRPRWPSRTGTSFAGNRLARDGSERGLGPRRPCRICRRRADDVAQHRARPRPRPAARDLRRGSAGRRGGPPRPPAPSSRATPSRSRRRRRRRGAAG